MSRIEENQRRCDNWNNASFSGSPEQVSIRLKVAEINALMYISQSLAIIADWAAAELEAPMDPALFYNKEEADDGK